MDKTIIVDVTQEDIENGSRRNGTACPIARAVFRATGADFVSVGLTKVAWKMASGIRYLASLPERATAFIIHFDIPPYEPADRRGVVPIQIELEPTALKKGE
jgi:hypothetical protein